MSENFIKLHQDWGLCSISSGHFTYHRQKCITTNSLDYIEKMKEKHINFHDVKFCYGRRASFQLTEQTLN